MSGHFFAECKFAPCSQSQDRIVWDGLETLYNGERGPKLYRESFSPNCWLRDPDKPPTVQLSHDGEVVGEVGVVIAHREWHIATLVLEDLPIVRERFTPGAKVSLEARSLSRYEDADLRLVRHTVCRLDHIALVQPGAIPGFVGATITSVQEAPKTQSRPRSDHPRIVDGIELQPGDELLDHRGRVIARRETEGELIPSPGRLLSRPGIGSILGIR